MLKNRENTVGFNDLFILRKNLRYPLLQCFGRTQIVYIYCIYIYIYTQHTSPKFKIDTENINAWMEKYIFQPKHHFFAIHSSIFGLKLCNLILSPKKQLHSDVFLPPNPLGDTGRSAGRLITPRKELSDLQNLDWFFGSNLPKHKLGVFFVWNLKWKLDGRVFRLHNFLEGQKRPPSIFIVCVILSSWFLAVLPIKHFGALTPW